MWKICVNNRGCAGGRALGTPSGMAHMSLSVPFTIGLIASYHVSV